MEPFIKICYSESSDSRFAEGSTIHLSDANRIFEERDVFCQDNNVIENVSYEISYTVNGTNYKYYCSQYLGNGDGSVINHLRKSALENLKNFRGNVDLAGVSGNLKKTFSVIINSYEEMLDTILPELEVYCIAYKTNDVLKTIATSNCNKILLSGVDSLCDFIKEKPAKFIELLENVIDANPQDVGIINAIDVLIIYTERYCQLLEKKSLEELLTEATQKAVKMKENSIISQLSEPPPDNIEHQYDFY